MGGGADTITSRGARTEDATTTAATAPAYVHLLRMHACSSHQEEGWLDECRSPGAVSWVTACTLAERRMRRPAATGFSRAVVFFLPPCSAFGAAAANGWIDGS